MMITKKNRDAFDKDFWSATALPESMIGRQRNGCHIV